MLDITQIQIFAFADEACAYVPGQIAALRRNGLDGLEVRRVDKENISKLSLEKAKELRRMLDDHGLLTWSIGSPIGKIRMNEDFQAHLDTYRHTLEVAQILGAKKLRMFSFYMGEDDPSVHRRNVTDRIGQLLDLAEGTGIVLCHENEKGIYGSTAERCADLHQTFPKLRAVFDPANFVQCGEDTLRAWEILAPYVEYLHIKDSLANGRVVPAGMGVGNVPKIIKAYLAQGGSALTLEPHLKVFDGLKELEEEGNTSAVGGYSYPSADAAFDASCNALREILKGV